MDKSEVKCSRESTSNWTEGHFIQETIEETVSCRIKGSLSHI